MSTIEIIAVVLVALAGLTCWGFAIAKMIRDSRRMADEEEMARRGPPIPWTPGLVQTDEEAPQIQRTREGTVSGGMPTILKTDYPLPRAHAERLEADIHRAARERVEKRRSEEISRRARERTQNEAEIQRKRLGDDDHTYVSGMAWPTPSPDTGKKFVPVIEPGGGTSGGG